MCRKLVNLINSHVSHCKRQKWPPVSEHNLSSRFHFSWFISPVLNLICDSFINSFFSSWKTDASGFERSSHPRWQSSFQIKAFLGGASSDVGAELCASNCELMLSTLLQQWTVLCFSTAELCHWIVITGVCRTVSLVLAWRYVSDAPTILHCRLSTGRP